MPSIELPESDIDEAIDDVYAEEGEESEDEDESIVTELHFQERQRRRTDSERREEVRRIRERVEVAEGTMRRNNAGRPPERQADAICVNCFSEMNTHLETVARTRIGLICMNCDSRHFVPCVRCQASATREEVRQTPEGGNVCQDCSRNYVECRNCHTLLDRGDNESDINTYNATGTCPYCVSETVQQVEDYNNNTETMTYSNDRPNARSYSTRLLSSAISEEKGAIMKSTRIFSAEMETASPNYKAMNKAIAHMPKSMGFCGDGTINVPSHYGMEFQTPKLAGKQGEEYLTNVCKAMTDNKFETNKTCGLHIHLSGGKDFIAGKKGSINNRNGQNVKHLMLFYMTFEDVIHSFLPASRRINNFCRPIKKAYHESEILNAPDLAELERVWYRASNQAQVANCKNGGKHSSRYCGVNMHTLLSDNHLEIRYHSGTISARKILEWANLHALIMDGVASGKVSQEQIENASAIINLEDKTERMFKLVGLTVASQKYFFRRQEKFTTKGDTSEENDIKLT